MSSENVTTNATEGGSDEQKGRGFPWAVVVLGVGLVASLGVGAYQHMNLVNTRMQTSALEREVATLRQTLNSSDLNVTQSLSALRAELDSTRKESLSSTEKAKESARRQAEAIAARVSTKLSQEQNEHQKVLADELDQIKSRTEQATARLTDITTEVGSVRTDVASTRTDLDKTVAELHRTTGDLGVLSGLIATNSKELSALRELGEREYFEFTLSKTSAPQRVGDILVQLKKSDPKRNRFTMEIVADDKKVEKKDRNINEPVQFYVVSKARQPYELVVNAVKKDQVVGYLASPKVKVAGRKL
ncbi:hypothetical protein [uncultured Paludibaculum sp.]|uniref:hypothetical protein n=1 Tax=uncultured Paludibaculum sp. TaxID=1765020 RepID=UPI002AAA68F4|nr:hypothetical protein [uncultured Paludibaculum sp.]